ncbi:RNA polymerase sigma factor, partial [Dietzia sp.]|uniref:RNA polymerase sigma factor n=1 Tax=Dietzia sp. TaxID=1871616 RepID=UPI002FD8E4BC
PEAVAEAREIWDRVAALPERQRLAIAYHYLGGLPHGETADLIGGSPDSVRRAAADGMRTLRAAYLGAAEGRPGRTRTTAKGRGER